MMSWRKELSVLVLVALGTWLAIVDENRRYAARPRWVYCRLADREICAFWTTNNQVVRVVWQTNVCASGLVVTSQVVTGRLW